ncbi:hypothetical protein [Planctomyces sp. SH-PL62]|uniref:hypothetical protein n=1 Tax=Planctomyces sp. SH-PL62 TaxID=1636152 RepID=UPI00078CD71F|nr:hypothetical protein [Planctomyces sp. SH-PL62]AMV39812.1 hypothetical protein VT85_20440 [Planctomyces sp. SH-PL62]
MIAVRGRRARRGSLLIEAAMSAVMLMIAMTLITKVIGAVASERRTWDRRQSAAVEAANVVEFLKARPFDGLTPDSAREVAARSQAASRLPGAEVTAEVTGDDAAGGPGSKRVAVQVRWRNRAGDFDAPVKLTTWVHRRKEGS